MSPDLTNVLLAALLESALLDDAQSRELTDWVAAGKPDPPALVRELRKRAWFTDFQLKEISRGRGKELTLGTYVLLDLLGEGGMGRVYKAHHTRLGRVVALKVIRREKLSKVSVIQRFQQEIRAAAQLSHPNVVLAFDADEVNGIHFFAMEYVEGVDLTKVVRDSGPVPAAKACDYLRQAAMGLQHAFERNLVHRDVKPSNLLLTPRGQVKVLDLGLAMLNEPGLAEDGPRVTQVGLVLGTPDFLAPEQARNPQLVDIRADIYALGGTLYYLLTGRVPYEFDSPTDKLVAHVTEPPPSLRAALPDADPGLDGLVQWLMAKRPEDRPQTPAQAAQALAAFCPAADATPGSATTSIRAALSARIPVPGSVRSTPAAIPTPEPAPPSARGAVPQEPAVTEVTPALDFLARPLTLPDAPRSRGPRPAPAPRFKPLTLALIVGGALLASLAVGAGGFLLFNPGGDPASRPLPNDYTNSLNIKLVKVAPGAFSMGAESAEPGFEPGEGPPATASISKPFFLGVTEVTQGQFKSVMGKSPATMAPKMRKSGETPVDSVTYAEAVEFCQKLTALDRTRRAGWAYRLPTEAEWEYACRAGTAGPFWSGPKLVYGKSAIFSLDKEQSLRTGLGEEDLTRPKMERNFPYPAASTEPNLWGLHDLHGNVWEWCQDYYVESGEGHSGADPRGPAAGDFRSLRGGSWREPPTRCRSAARRGVDPAKRFDDVGFRVVLAEE